MGVRGTRSKVYLSRHIYGYKVITFDDKGEVLADFFGRGAKEKALQFVKERGYRLVYAPR